MNLSENMSTIIEAINHTESYDRENALIDLYILLKSKNELLLDKNNTVIFIELSQWRDYSLRDGAEAYYEEKSEAELIQIEKAMERYYHREICQKYMDGIKMYRQQGDMLFLDEWIVENEWNINDFLADLAQ
uniref:hypothetical protein n=1 Tax=Agathobacter sp. TaxID=2021311 RepID=UPI00405701A9